MTSGEWSNWINPDGFLAATNNSSSAGYAAMRKDTNFSSLFERLEKCVIIREIQQ